MARSSRQLVGRIEAPPEERRLALPTAKNHRDQLSEIFDGTEVAGDAGRYRPFDEVLAKWREMRDGTIALLGCLSEEDLDKPSGGGPKGWEDSFGSYRLCLQYVADHWYMHRDQLADARRAAGLERMWV